MSVHGLMIINSDTGKLVYERDYSECRFGLVSKEHIKSGKETGSGSFLDPLNLSALIYSMIKFGEAAFGEPGKQRVLKIAGNAEILFEYSKNFPLVIVLFYSGLEYEIMQETAQRLLEAFLSKYEQRVFSATETARFHYSQADKLFLPVYEELIILSLKCFVLDLYNLNLYVPWIYVCLLAPPKIPIVQESLQGSFFVPMESGSITGNKAKIMYCGQSCDTHTIEIRRRSTVSAARRRRSAR
ncbi:MAG: hypothetical protein P4M11_10610 [Candidatus Pacebacteria bacterium]|nr:hypothetical protein [Candidatus Paceibacterota bacterium]